MDWKEVFKSILIGACIAFLTTFLEGALHYLQGLENNLAGGVVGAVWYAVKHHPLIRHHV